VEVPDAQAIRLLEGLPHDARRLDGRPGGDWHEEFDAIQFERAVRLLLVDQRVSYSGVNQTKLTLPEAPFSRVVVAYEAIDLAPTRTAALIPPAASDTSSKSLRIPAGFRHHAAVFKLLVMARKIGPRHCRSVKGSQLCSA
jgi:hypothetical protein